MKLKYIFIPAILLTILVVGICKHYYNLDLLSMDQVCMISIASFIAFFTVFFGIYVCTYEASKAVAERQTEHIDQLSRLIAQHVNECFKVHDALTKDVLKQELTEAYRLLLDIQHSSTFIKDTSFVAKNASLNCEHLANEAIERLDNVLLCLRRDDVEEKDVGEDEIKVVGE